MGIIHRLPITEIQKIAAGEVVERPANVVKELVENALDAGATQISIFIEDGGKSLIRVIDNGHGMDGDDAVACFEHHATSKISSVHDLATVTSFGFRGEALSSIAAVSNVTLVTKQTSAPLATRVTLDAGSVITQEHIAGPDGTDIIISNLLFNVPARRKFLRTTETESRQILHLLQAFCLAHPTIYFSYKNDGYSLTCPATSSLTNRVAQLWQQGQSPTLLALESTATISGVVSNHGYGRFDRNWMFFFVNGRWIKNFTLGRAIVAGYANVLPTGKYPIAAISITVPPETVDINVHPRKEELVFVNPRKIEQAITQAVTHALELSISGTLQASRYGWHETQSSNDQILNDLGLPGAVTFNPSLAPENQDAQKEHFEFSRHQNSTGNTQAPLSRNVAEQALSLEPFTSDTTAASYNDVPITQTSSISTTPATPTTTLPHHHSLPFEQSAKPFFNAHSPTIFNTSTELHNYQLIGQLHKTYLLLEHEDGLLIIDQHAAHERILYEQLDSAFINIASTQLIFPEILTLSTHDLELLTPHLALLEQHGFAVAVVGAQQLAITATPVLIKNINMQELFHFLINTIVSIQGLDAASLQRIVSEKLRAQIACKTAVKAGDVLPLEQMQQLLKDLHKTPHRFSCPHGRPTSWLLPTYDIEKKFKRDYR